MLKIYLAGADADKAGADEIDPNQAVAARRRRRGKAEMSKAESICLSTGKAGLIRVKRNIVTKSFTRIIYLLTII